jgi:hypothetical protein
VKHIAACLLVLLAASALPARGQEAAPPAPPGAAVPPAPAGAPDAAPDAPEEGFADELRTAVGGELSTPIRIARGAR